MQHKPTKCILFKLILQFFFFLILTSSICFEPQRFILRKTVVNAVLYGKFTCIGVCSPAGGTVCSILINYALR